MESKMPTTTDTTRGDALTGDRRAEIAADAEAEIAAIAEEYGLDPVGEFISHLTSREVFDPFMNKTVEISSRLTDRLRGKYAVGPTLPNGEPEFGWRQHETPPIQHEAADRIESLERWIGFYKRIAAIRSGRITSGDDDEQRGRSCQPNTSPPV